MLKHCFIIRRALLVAVGVVHVLQHADRHQERRRDPLQRRRLQLCQVARRAGQGYYIRFGYSIHMWKKSIFVTVTPLERAKTATV